MTMKQTKANTIKAAEKMVSEFGARSVVLRIVADGAFVTVVASQITVIDDEVGNIVVVAAFPRRFQASASGKKTRLGGSTRAFKAKSISRDGTDWLVDLGARDGRVYFSEPILDADVDESKRVRRYRRDKGLRDTGVVLLSEFVNDRAVEVIR